MSERQSGREAPWPESDPRDIERADQRPEEAPAEVTGDEDRDGRDTGADDRGDRGPHPAEHR